jgi:hypothetical protein
MKGTVFTKIRWAIIRYLLRKSEQVFLFESCDFLHRNVEKSDEWCAGEVHYIGELKRKVAGEINYEKWN